MHPGPSMALIFVLACGKAFSVSDWMSVYRIVCSQMHTVFLPVIPPEICWFNLLRKIVF